MSSFFLRRITRSNLQLACILLLSPFITTVAITPALADEPNIAIYVKPPVWGLYSRGETEGVFAGLGPDALYKEFRSGRKTGTEQLNNGEITFLNGLMPLEFVYYVTSSEREITLYGGENSPNLSEVLVTSLLYGGGYPHPNSVDLKVINVQIPERYKGGWANSIAQKQPIILKPREIAYVRVRVEFKKDVNEWIKAQRQVNPKQPPSLTLAMGADIGAIKGNGELKKVLYQQKLGRPKEIFAPSVRFNLVDQNDIDDALRLEYYLWRIKSLKFDAPRSWQKENQVAIIEAFEGALKARPNSEMILLMYADDLEKMGRNADAIKVLSTLIEVVQKVPRDKFPIMDIELNELKLPFMEGPEDMRLIDPVNLVLKLKNHITRLGENGTN